MFFSIILAFVFKTREAYLMAGFLCFFAFFFCGGRESAEDIRRKNTFYVITKRKIIRKQGSKIDFTYSNRQHEIEVTMHKDGHGTIKFLDMMLKRPLTYLSPETETKCYFHLDNIPNVREVEKLIRDLGERNN